jgi:flagellar biosynthetic protein FliQ
MNEETALSLGLEAIKVAVEVGGPLLLASLLIGLLVSIFQAATQIQEQMLTVIPKLVGIVVVIILLGPWMLGHLTAFATQLYNSIPSLVG